MQVRRQARIAVLQALYELDTTNHPAGEVIAYRLEDGTFTPEGEEFLRLLVAGVLRFRERLDALDPAACPGVAGLADRRRRSQHLAPGIV